MSLDCVPWIRVCFKIILEANANTFFRRCLNALGFAALQITFGDFLSTITHAWEGRSSITLRTAQVQFSCPCLNSHKIGYHYFLSLKRLNLDLQKWHDSCVLVCTTLRCSFTIVLMGIFLRSKKLINHPIIVMKTQFGDTSANTWLNNRIYLVSACLNVGLIYSVIATTVLVHTEYCIVLQIWLLVASRTFINSWSLPVLTGFEK